MKKLSVILLAIFLLSYSGFSQEKDMELSLLPQPAKQLTQQYIDILQSSKHIVEFYNKLENAKICDGFFASHEGILSEQRKTMAKKDFEVKDEILNPIEFSHLKHDNIHVNNKLSDAYYIFIKKTDGSAGCVVVAIPQKGMNKTPKVIWTNLKQY
ncbi:MAG: hypothetical protein JXL97_12465 [Bacteroidales bacterium]|nr:hypothetical protein [Bacteroidales bacterium]